VEPERVPTLVDEWKVLWPQLKEKGWTCVKAGKYNRLHDWYYVCPGCDPGSADTKIGEHYFLSEQDVVDFVKASDWRPKAASVKEIAAPSPATNEAPRKDDNTSKHTAKLPTSNDGNPQTPLDCKTKPQDPAIPLPASPESSIASDDDSYAWDNLWPRLHLAGWRHMNAAKYNKLHDYYYVRPQRDPGDANTQLGRHYFQTKEEVIQFEKMREENEGKSKVARESMDVMQTFFEKEAEVHGI
jgi:hypothetical protein